MYVSLEWEALSIVTSQDVEGGLSDEILVRNEWDVFLAETFVGDSAVEEMVG